MRFRITVRGQGVELRGYLDGDIEKLGAFSDSMKPFGVVVASPMAEHEVPDDPNLASSIERVEDIHSTAEGEEAFRAEMAILHYMQAVVIRGERDQREYVEREMAARELHHFETEQIIEKIKIARSNHPECDKHDENDPVTCGWKRAVQDIDAAMEKWNG